MALSHLRLFRANPFLSFIFAGADFGPHAAANAGANAHAHTAADPFADAASVVGKLFLRAS